MQQPRNLAALAGEDRAALSDHPRKADAGQYETVMQQPRKPLSRSALSHPMCHWLDAAVNVHAEESAPMCAHQWPQNLAIRHRNRQSLNVRCCDPFKAPFVKLRHRDFVGADMTRAFEQEDEPVHLALISAFADHTEHAHVFFRKCETRLFLQFTNGALVRTLATANFKFAAHWGVHVNVRLLLAMQHENATLGVPQVAKNSDLVWKCGGVVLGGM